MSDKVRAVIREVDGQIVLDDPDALAVVRAVAKHNCRVTFEETAERIVHFARRIDERGMDSDDVVIVVANVDDPQGGALAEALMPGFDWQAIRDKGMIPYARGLANRSGIQNFLERIDDDAAGKLAVMEEKAVVVVDFQVAKVFAVSDLSEVLPMQVLSKSDEEFNAD